MSDAADQIAWRELAVSDLHAFTHYMFYARRRRHWVNGPHHREICNALMRVVSGECTRLIINIPPRYSKTELAAINFIAWSLGHYPDSEFIYTSYSARLAAHVSLQIRDLVQHEEYQALNDKELARREWRTKTFNGVQIRDDSRARDEWRTTAGGIMYAVGTGGTITGYGAGKQRGGFGGCFPAGTRVWTEHSPVPIDRIVRDRLRVNVWAYDYSGRMVLRPVTGWHENPPNDIVRVTFNDGTSVECTPDHRFWTNNRGWVRADSLGVDDVLPRIDGEIANRVHPFISGDRTPVLVEYVRHDPVTFCLTVEDYHNFTIESGVVVKNCIIIDDPHKADEARSDTIREGVIDWFQNTLESRKNAQHTPIILIMQRLHERDLAGWLLDGGNGEEWEHVCLPAITDTGEALWPEKHTIDDLRRMEEASPYVFSGQYMQRPSPPEGGIIKPDRIETIDAAPASVTQWVRGWDLAATIEGDYTAGCKLGRLPDGRYVIADMVRERCGPDERDAALRNTAARDGRAVRISIPQDPGQAGKSQAMYIARQLAGYAVDVSPESGDKITRASPAAAQINVGNMLMVRGAWNDAFIDELRMFPNGRHDDQVDALSRAFSSLMTMSTGYAGAIRRAVV